IGAHRGVYRVGHAAPCWEATYAAAVLACGHGALLGGAASARLLSLIDGVPPAPEVWTSKLRRVSGIRTRRVQDVRGTVWLGIPTITVPRALMALAPILPLDGLARACHQAWVRHRVGAFEVPAGIP